MIVSRADPPRLIWYQMTRLYRSFFFSAIDRMCQFDFFASTGILARLLSPIEFGVHAVVDDLTTVAGTSLQEFGGSTWPLSAHFAFE
jgi:hypothetical protein